MKNFLIILTVFVFASCLRNTDCEPFTVSAIQDFRPVEKEGYVPFYVEENFNTIAVDASQYPDQFSIAEFTFDRDNGTYTISIVTLVERDGESTYLLFLNEEQVATVQNIRSEADFEPLVLEFGSFDLQPGTRIAVAFNAHSNELIPEDDHYAWARGRWSELVFALVCD
jgi:hypothetical protein